QAKAEMHAKISAMRERLLHSLRVQFENEIQRSLQRIHEAIAPYTRFVRAEQNKLKETQAELERIQKDLIRIKAAVEDI
ncbi:MAG: hypothetical protein JSV61_11860, partial [Anaerolineales bacterium]